MLHTHKKYPMHSRNLITRPRRPARSTSPNTPVNQNDGHNPRHPTDQTRPQPPFHCQITHQTPPADSCLCTSVHRATTAPLVTLLLVHSQIRRAPVIVAGTAVVLPTSRRTRHELRPQPPHLCRRTPKGLLPFATPRSLTSLGTGHDVPRSSLSDTRIRSRDSLHKDCICQSARIHFRPALQFRWYLFLSARRPVWQ
jgi:hypothetical protein